MLEIAYLCPTVSNQDITKLKTKTLPAGINVHSQKVKKTKSWNETVQAYIYIPNTYLTTHTIVIMFKRTEQRQSAWMTLTQATTWFFRYGTTEYRGTEIWPIKYHGNIPTQGCTVHETIVSNLTAVKSLWDTVFLVMFTLLSLSVSVIRSRLPHTARDFRQFLNEWRWMFKVMCRCTRRWACDGRTCVSSRALHRAASRSRLLSNLRRGASRRSAELTRVATRRVSSLIHTRGNKRNRCVSTRAERDTDHTLELSSARVNARARARCVWASEHACVTLKKINPGFIIVIVKPSDRVFVNLTTNIRDQLWFI